MTTVDPLELPATIYHAFGISLETIVYNHLANLVNWLKRARYRVVCVKQPFRPFLESLSDLV